MQLHLDDASLLQLVRSGLAHAHATQRISGAGGPKTRYFRILVRSGRISIGAFSFPFVASETLTHGADLKV